MGSKARWLLAVNGKLKKGRFPKAQPPNSLPFLQDPPAVPCPCPPSLRAPDPATGSLSFLALPAGTQSWCCCWALSASWPSPGDLPQGVLSSSATSQCSCLWKRPSVPWFVGQAARGRLAPVSLPIPKALLSILEPLGGWGQSCGGDLCPLPAPWCCACHPPQRDAPGAALAEEVPGRRAEPRGAGTIWEQGPRGIQHSADRDSRNSSGSWGSQQLLDAASHPGGSCWTGAGDPSSCWIPQQNPSGSCWVSLEQPRAGTGSAGFGAGSAGAGEL